MRLSVIMRQIFFSSRLSSQYVYVCLPVYHPCLSVPCCPEGVSVSAVSTETLEITWTASRGAELYETRAAGSSEVILCNDTAPVCALSDLRCDSAYSVVVTPCNEISGCNRACKAHTKDTGGKLLFIYACIQLIPSYILHLSSVYLTYTVTLWPTFLPRFHIKLI